MGERFALNVLQFRSTMMAAIDSAQTKTALHHFPVRCDQPDIQFTARFRHYDDKHLFQAFVRRHQVSGRTAPNAAVVVLRWPERGIVDWTGHITDFAVAERRYEISPAVTFGVSLVDSMMSRKTDLTSVAMEWTSIWGAQGGVYSNPGEVIAHLPESITRNLFGVRSGGTANPTASGY